MLKPFLACCLLLLVKVSFTTVIEDEEENQPEGIRQVQNGITRVINDSSVAVLEEETIANASSAVSNTSLADIENDNITQSLQLRYRERKKQERIIVIQAQILHRLRMNRQPNITASIFSEDEQRKIAMIVERMHLMNNNAQSDSVPPGFATQQFHETQRLQSFYPSCSLPNNTDTASWEYPGTFRVFYDVPFNKNSLNSEIKVMLAKLRLYKITGNVDPNFVGWDSNQATLPRYNLLDSLINSRAANGINVAIYQYTKPLRMNKREKKKLIDSRTLSVDYEGWVEFNVITSLNYWLHHSRRNFGFDVEVEDAYGNKLNPNLYFQNMNCSGEIPQDPPFPNIMELHPEMGENDSSLFDNETYPTLDLQTAEIPRDFSNFDILVDQLNDRVIKKRSNRGLKLTCQKEEVYVSFAELGLDDYIFWPPGVYWTFCKGGCDPVSAGSRHAPEQSSFLSSWFHRFFRLRKTSSDSSCVSARREPLPIIFYNGENQVIETVLEDMIPKDCICKAS